MLSLMVDCCGFILLFVVVCLLLATFAWCLGVSIAFCGFVC